MIPTLETERLLLRPWREADHPALARFMASEPARFVGGPMHEADSWRRLALFLGHWQLRGFGPWALEEKGTARLAGYAGLWHPFGFPESEILYALFDEAFRGRGYATEAALRARRHAYEALGWRTAVSFILPENVPSQRVAARSGARLEGSATFAFNDGPWRHPQVWRHPSPTRPTTDTRPSGENPCP
jgi:RimJ/RimL family protein N-acetyltransferase